MDRYGRLKNEVEGKGLRVNIDETKGMQLFFGKKSSVLKVDPCGVCSDGLVVVLFSVRNVGGGFIVAVLMCLGRRPVNYHVVMSLSVEHVLVIIFH